MNANFEALEDEFWCDIVLRADYTHTYGNVYLATLRYMKVNNCTCSNDADDSIKRLARVSWNTYFKAIEWLEKSGFIIYKKGKNQTIQSYIRIISVAQFKSTDVPPTYHRRTTYPETPETASRTYGHAQAPLDSISNNKINSSSSTPSSLSPAADGGRRFDPGHPPSQDEMIDQLAIINQGISNPTKMIVRIVEGVHYTKSDIGKLWRKTFPENSPQAEALLKRGRDRFSIKSACNGAYDYIIADLTQDIHKKIGLIRAIDWYMERALEGNLPMLTKQGAPIRYGSQMNA